MIRQFKKELKTLLAPIGTMHFETAPEKAVFPHMIVDIPNSYHQEGQFQLTLDIDVWDKNASTVNVDAMVISIIDTLDRLHFNNEKIGFTCWLTNLLNVGSEDKTLKRTTAVFEVQLRRTK